jgi:hypothetical protein
MILFPLMTTWIWFQIFKASPLLTLVPRRRANAEISWLPVPFEGG